jgi:membrane protein
MTDPNATDQTVGGSGEGAAQPDTILAVIAWALASVGFSFYLSNLANHSVIYGGLGTAIALLVFYLYLSAVALLLGEEVNAAINRGATDSAVQTRSVE